jgi:hypothetical protein
VRPTLPPRKRLNHVLAGAAVLLTVLAIWPWVAPVAAPRRAAEAADTPPPPPAIADLAPLAAFRAVFERPMFSPSRRPPADGKVPQLGIGIAERYRLLGLVSAGDARRALLAEGTRRFEIAEGAALDGWTVARIEQDRVVLSSPSGETELRLYRAVPNGVNPSAPEKPVLEKPMLDNSGR